MEYSYGKTMDEGPIEVAELFEWESSSVLSDDGSDMICW
jgi:hypothetical protein